MSLETRHNKKLPNMEINIDWHTKVPMTDVRMQENKEQTLWKLKKKKLYFSCNESIFLSICIDLDNLKGFFFYMAKMK